MRKSFLMAILTALSLVSGDAVAGHDEAAVEVPKSQFRNGKMIFDSILISKDMIRVNIGFHNSTTQPVYLWSSNYPEKCATASLIDDQGNEYTCVGESLFTLTPYSRPDEGFTVAPDTVVKLQYQFQRSDAAPGETFNFAAAPLLYAKRATPEPYRGLRDTDFWNESLGINFTDLPVKVRPLSAK
jgi:hypothetical protein